MSVFTIQADELVRAVSNVNAFCPARSKAPYVNLNFVDGTLRLTVTDLYAAASDEAPCTGSGDAEIILTRDGAAALEKAARAAKKLPVTLKVYLQGLRVEAPDSEPLTLTKVDSDEANGLRELVDELLFDKPESDPPKDGEGTADNPGVHSVAFQPQLLAYLAKVKPSAGNVVADLWFTHPNQAVYAKVGPTFKAAIMPVRRAMQPEGALF